MATISQNQLLDNVRLNNAVQDQADRFLSMMPMRFLDRVRAVNAEDNEILGRYTERNLAADVVADGQAAAVYSAGQMTLVATTLLNIKFGIGLDQAMLRAMGRIAQGAGIPADANAVLYGESRIANQLIRGIRAQENGMIAGMMIDSYSYNRNGVVFSGSWGKPSDLKSTPSTLWTSTSATPITDLLTMIQYAANTYGVVINRITMPTADFQNMTATTEFKSEVSGAVGWAATTSSFNSLSPLMRSMAQNILNCTIELDDTTYQRQNPDGTYSSQVRALPLGKVLLDNSNYDTDPTVWDWGNAVVDESRVGPLAGHEAFRGGEVYGPVAFYTAPDDLNPPRVTAFGVARGFPRCHQPTASAVLTVR